MGELWRSEEMTMVQLFIPMEAAHDTIDRLGKLGLMQFRDLNEDVNLFKRSFVTDVKRMDELDRIMRFFEDQVKKENEEEELEVDTPLPGLEKDEEEEEEIDVDELEAECEDLEKELIQMNSNKEMLSRNYNELIELEQVLTKDSAFFQGSNDDGTVVIENESDSEAPLMEEDGQPMKYAKAVRLGFVTGVIDRELVNSFERILWRATRGNLFMKQSEIEKPIADPNKPGKAVEKNVFIIFYQGSRAESKIKKICESYGAHLYPCPESAKDRRDLLQKVDSRIEELDTVRSRANEHRRRVLTDIANKLPAWKYKVLKEKSIYHTMNMFDYDQGRKCLIADGWVPAAHVDDVRDVLKVSNRQSGSSVPSILNVIKAKEEPPTYYKTNKLTTAFQSIVDAYGIARYQEVNPGVLTVVSFPFLFGIMFGDLGHGFLLLLFALYLVIREKHLSSIKLDEMVKTCFDGRYVLLLMGLSSMYNGSLYNEVFSVPMHLFKSGWIRNGGEEQLEWTHPSTVYPWGVDPAWKYKKNELIFYNSLKMKISIIFGVSQMTVGILLSGWNGLYFKKPLNIFFEFIPQMCFMMSIFGYMCILIFWKWSTEYDPVDDAPGLLNMMINMFLKPYDPLADSVHIYKYQEYVQAVLIVVALVSVPMMLFPKPLILRWQHKKEEARKQRENPGMLVEEEDSDSESSESSSDSAGHSSGGGHGHGEEFDFSEIFVHQIIHTIEFVLGCVSNTASYLRLWALSLAHSELAWVFWSYILVEIGLASKNFFLIWACFAIWAGCTFGVLMVMESLSAFLHALRLHWVEFQNKFYQGDGYAFEPFSYERIVAAEEEE